MTRLNKLIYCRKNTRNSNFTTKIVIIKLNGINSLPMTGGDDSVVVGGRAVVDARIGAVVSALHSSAVKHSHSVASNVDSFSSKYNSHLISCCCFAFVESSRKRKTRIWNSTVGLRCVVVRLVIRTPSRPSRHIWLLWKEWIGQILFSL